MLYAHPVFHIPVFVNRDVLMFPVVSQHYYALHISHFTSCYSLHSVSHIVKSEITSKSLCFKI